MPQRTKNMYFEGLLHLSTGILEKTKDQTRNPTIKGREGIKPGLFFS